MARLMFACEVVRGSRFARNRACSSSSSASDIERPPRLPRPYIYPAIQIESKQNLLNLVGKLVQRGNPLLRGTAVFIKVIRIDQKTHEDGWIPGMIASGFYVIVDDEVRIF